MGFGEDKFHAVGKVVAHNPWTTILCSMIVVFATGSGFFVARESENRPDKQWVPLGSPSLKQGDYVKETWPSSQRFSFYIAKCKGENCNIFVTAMYSHNK